MSKKTFHWTVPRTPVKTQACRPGKAIHEVDDRQKWRATFRLSQGTWLYHYDN